jgi:hypothetical protein
VPAVQTIYHDPEQPSRLLLPVLGDVDAFNAHMLSVLNERRSVAGQ